MFDIVQVAGYFEKGLNDFMRERLGDTGYQFKIWASAGKYIGAKRDGNTVEYTINGELKTTASAVEPNIIEMGTNVLSLEFAIPIDPPQVNFNQTPAELETYQFVDAETEPKEDPQQKYQSLQIAFLHEVEGLLSGYFTPTKAEQWQDGQGNSYTVGIRGGVDIPQLIDLSAPIGNFIAVGVTVELTFVAGGTNSFNIHVLMDGEEVPIQNFTPSRAAEMSSNVYDGDLISRSIASSSAFATQFTFPATNDEISKAALDFLLGGALNKAHFLDIQWGIEGNEGSLRKIMLVTLTRGTGAKEGVVNAGITVEVVETVDDLEMLTFPTGFQLGYFTYSTSASGTITLPEGSAYYYAAGQAGQGAATVDFTAKDLVYDGTEYRLYVLTSQAVSLGADFTEV